MDRITALEKALEFFLTDLKLYEVTQDRFKKDPEFLFTISIPDNMVPLIRKIETGCKTLNEICDEKITEGDTRREEEKYVINNENYEQLPESEKIPYRKVIRGVNVRRYVVEWGNYYIKSLSEIATEYRLLIKDYSKRLTVACEEDQKYRCLRTVYCAYLKDPDFNPKYVLALLNSTLLHFYYLAYFYTSRPGKGSFRFRTQFLKRLPTKYVNDDFQDQIVEKIQKIISYKTELVNLRQKVSDFPDSYSETGWVINKLINVIKAKNLSKSSYKISKKLRTMYLRDLEGKEIFRIILARNEFLDFSSEEEASYILEVFKKLERITIRELLELKIPAVRHLKNLMNQYRKDMENILEIEKTIKLLEKEIDNFVYKIYDISYEERRIVEDYLKKF